MADQSIVPLFCKEDENKLEIESRNWSDIPIDLLSFILQRCFLRDHHVVKAVCKSWNLVDTVLHLPPPVHSPYFDSPCLMFFFYGINENKLSWKLFHSVYNNSYYLDFPEELLGAQICYSKYGWLLMSQGKYDYFFFYPCTKIKIELPSTEDSFHQVCFTSPPTSADCVIFGIFSSSNLIYRDFGYIKLGDEEWTVCEYSNINRSPLTNCSPVFRNGLFYCLDHKGNLGAFDPHNEDNQWVQYTKCHKKEISDVLYESYMAEVDGKIWGVFVHKDRRVGVYQLNLRNVVWKPLQDLDNKCLYVSPKVSFAETSDVKSLANKVYFNKFYEDNGVVYSLTSKKYHSVEGSFSSKEVDRLKDMLHSTWF